MSLFETALSRIPGGVNSPVRSFKHVGMEPIFFERAQGPYLFDVDGKKYIDFCLSFGPHILGHSHPSVVGAIKAQVDKATSFGACHPGEVELASLILRAFPFLDKTRLVSSGTEAVMTAARIARGFTKRSKILMFDGCYHGHSDGFLAKAGSGVAELSEASSQGVPAAIVENTLVARFDDKNEIEAMFETHGSDIAAVVFEVIPANNGLWVPDRERIQQIFRLAKEHGALVIADEVITGFRVGISGASGYYDVKPDLVTLGKIIGGGLPLAAIVGRKDVMDVLAPVGPVYQAGTLSGNPLAVAAGIAVLKELFATVPYEKLAKTTASFAKEVEALLPKPVQMVTFASMFWFHLGEESKAFPPKMAKDAAPRYAEFFKRALKEGVYFAPSPYEVGFVSTAHTDSVLNETLEKLKKCAK